MQIKTLFGKIIPYLLFILGMAVCCQAGMAAGNPPMVRLVDNRLWLKAHQTPLMTILQQLANQGLVIQADPALNPPVSLKLTGVSLDEGLDILLRRVNHVVTWTRRGNSFFPVAIQIFSKGNKSKMQTVPGKKRFLVEQDQRTGDLRIIGEVLLQKAPDISEEVLRAHIAALGGILVGKHEATAVYRVWFPPGTDIDALLGQLAKHPGISRAEPHFAVSLQVPAFSTRAEEASGITAEAGLGSVRVAVLDSGLAAEAATSPWLVTTYDAVTPGGFHGDTMGHGTQMAMIASGTVDPLGTNDTDPSHTPIVSIRVFDDNGFTSGFSLLEALDTAIRNNARVVSMSWGTETKSEFLQLAMGHAAANDLVLLAAAGNEATGNKVYPAAFEEVIGVGALQPDGKPWSSSNYGPFVEIMAPGFAVFTNQNGSEGVFTGTSIATAYAADKVARYLGDHPSATPKEIRAMLRSSFLPR